MARRRLILVSLAAVALAAAGGYTALWLYAAHAVEGGLAQWTAAARAAGANVEYGAPKLSGYPLALRLSVGSARVTAPHGLWRWSGDGLAAEVWPWAFRTVRIHPLGRQEASFPFAGGTETVATQDESAEIVARFDPRGRFVEGTFEAARLSLAAVLVMPGGAASPAPAPITAAGLHLEIAVPPPPATPPQGPDLPPSLDLELSAADLDFPAAASSPFGPHVSQLAATLQLMGRIEPGPPRAALAKWRDSGGTLEVRSLALDWGPLGLSGNATAALDAQLQPEGAASTQIRGYRATIQALEARGLIRPEAGSLLATFLTLMAKGQHNGDASTLSVPLSIQHQRLYVGPFGLMNVPAIEWPQ